MFLLGHRAVHIHDQRHGVPILRDGRNRQRQLSFPNGPVTENAPYGIRHPLGRCPCGNWNETYGEDSGRTELMQARDLLDLDLGGQEDDRVRLRLLVLGETR